MTGERTGDGARLPADDPRNVASAGPTVTGGLVGLVGGFGVVVVLVSVAPVLRWPTLAALLGAVALAVALVAVAHGAIPSLGAATAALCAPVIGAGLVGAVGGTWLLETAATFPAPTSEQVPEASLLVTATVGLALGLTLTVAGLAVLVAGGAGRERLRTLRRAAVRGGTLPAGAAGLLALGGLLSTGRATALGPLEAVATILDWLFGPAPSPYAPAPFLVLALVAVIGLRAVVPGAWPGDRQSGLWDAVPGPRAVVAGIGGVLVVVLGAVVLARLQTSPLAFRRTVTSLGVEPLLGLTGRGDLRVALGLLAVGTLPLAARTRLATLRQGDEATAIGRALAPHLSGLVLLGLTAAVAGPAIATGRDWIATRLPGPTSDAFLTGSERVIATVGRPAIALLVLTGLIAVCIGLVVALAGAERFGFLRADRAGPALTATGVLVASGFAGARGEAPVVVLAGVVVGLLVWDTGAFGATLRREIGRGARRLEGVHGLASLGVGVAAGVVAWLALERVSGNLVTGGTSGVTALAVVLVGLALLLAALR